MKLFDTAVKVTFGVLKFSIFNEASNVPNFPISLEPDELAETKEVEPDGDG